LGSTGIIIQSSGGKIEVMRMNSFEIDSAAVLRANDIAKRALSQEKHLA